MPKLGAILTRAMTLLTGKSTVGNASVAQLTSQDLYKTYRNSLGKMLLHEAQMYEPIQVEATSSDADAESMLAHIESVWGALGASDPHWSVVTAPQFKSEAIEQNLSEFFETGEREAAALDRILARNGIALEGSSSALEYGCGVGRMTTQLALRFREVIGVDISAEHLALAKGYASQRGLSNVSFRKIASLSEVKTLPKVDLVYSKIVLQHNPPPIMRLILSSMFGLLAPAGVMVVQIPTYCLNYKFVVKDYLQTMNGTRKMEMHILPQQEIFRLALEHDCTPLEVIRDHLVATMDFVSNTFVFRKSPV
jgi:trans-aconitate methyltransferase